MQGSERATASEATDSAVLSTREFHPESLIMYRRTALDVLTVSSLIIWFCGCRDSLRMSREEALIEAADPESWRRVGAVAEFAESGDPESLAQLRKLARDSDTQVRGMALEALGRWRDEQAIPILVDALMDDGTWKDCKERLGCYVLYERAISETAHKSLVKITRHRMDFDPSAGPDHRKAVQENWKRYLANQSSFHASSSR